MEKETPLLVLHGIPFSYLTPGTTGGKAPRKLPCMTTDTKYPSSHLYIWQAYVRTVHQVHSDISLQEKSLNDQLQSHSPPFSWLTFLQEGIKLANLSGLTDLTSCLMCAFLGQTPFVAVPYPIPLNLSASTSSFSPVREVDLYTPPDFEQLPVCYSLGRNFPSCNRTIRVTTNITAPQGTFFGCNKTLTKTLYIGLSSSLLCLPVTLVPRLTIYSPAEFQMLQTPHRRTRRAAFLPIAVGVSLAGSALAAGLGGGALVHSHLAIARLTSQLQAAIDDSTESLASLQRQITSVAQVALQNRRALDLLTAERGGTCIFLQEECCYYINESGLVETRIESLQKLKTNLQSQKFSAEATVWWSSSMYTLLSPLLGPLVAICLILLIAPCFLQFLQRRFQELTRVTIHQMLLQPYPERVPRNRPLPEHPGSLRKETSSEPPVDPCQQEVARETTDATDPLVFFSLRSRECLENSAPTAKALSLSLSLPHKEAPLSLTLHTGPSPPATQLPAAQLPAAQLPAQQFKLTNSCPPPRLLASPPPSPSSPYKTTLPL
uniref:Uncharacterized protein n=1 Tax=Callithrix jacchus TaxID=9483 RepID=A0A8I3ZZZ7_CALJA